MNKVMKNSDRLIGMSEEEYDLLKAVLQRKIMCRSASVIEQKLTRRVQTFNKKVDRMYVTSMMKGFKR